jgi:hypothetical protein
LTAIFFLLFRIQGLSMFVQNWRILQHGEYDHQACDSCAIRERFKHASLGVHCRHTRVSDAVGKRELPELTSEELRSAAEEFMEPRTPGLTPLQSLEQAFWAPSVSAHGGNGIHHPISSHIPKWFPIAAINYPLTMDNNGIIYK